MDRGGLEASESSCLEVLVVNSEVVLSYLGLAPGSLVEFCIYQGVHIFLYRGQSITITSPSTRTRGRNIA